MSDKPIAIGDLLLDEYNVLGMVIDYKPCYPHALEWIVEWFDGIQDIPDVHRAGADKVMQWRTAAEKLKEELKNPRR